MRRATGDLCDDVAFSNDRGPRDFARCNRLIFLWNERSLGVKNGTLGTIEQVSSERMTVGLDGGRSVAFEAKDYDAVDHGYGPRHIVDAAAANAELARLAIEQKSTFVPIVEDSDPRGLPAASVRSSLRAARL